METKTLDKIMRRFEILPLHFIDTDIIFEANNETKLGDQCSDYLNRIGYNYRGVISLSVIGEFFTIVFRDVQNHGERQVMFNFVDTFIKKRKIRFSTLRRDSFRIVDKIKEIDSRVEDTDAIHLANCVQDKGNTFVTFDEKLVENRKLEDEFTIKIIHPKNL